MRILHFSDLHIGVETYGQADPDTGLSTRLLDFLSAFDEVVSLAIDTRVDLVLFCGDAYKSRDPSQTHQREFAKRLALLSSAGVPVFLLVGNHDMPNITSRATALEIFPTLDVPSLYIGGTLDTYTIPTGDGPVQIVALPWVRRGTYLTREDTQGLTPDEVNDAIQRSLTQVIASRAQDLDPGLPAVLAGHVSVSGATVGSEVSMMLGRDHVMQKSSVALPQFDYVALGHVHRHQILGTDPHVVYSGSLQRVDFGEEKDDKGFCLVDLDPAGPVGARLRSFEFRPVEARSFVTVSVELKRGDPDPTGTVVKAIQGNSISDAIVRVSIRMPSEMEGHLRDGEVRAALTDAHFVASISREIIEESRTRLAGADAQTLAPKEALSRYLDNRSVPADRAKELMRVAELLMDELGPGDPPPASSG